VWSGPMTLVKSSGGECTWYVVSPFFPTLDRGTLSITQTDAATSAIVTTESTGLACRLTGTSSLTMVALNATSCERTGLLVSCKHGTGRLRLGGSSVTGSWTGTQFNGEVSSTYNVFTPPEGMQLGVGALVVNHSFTATRR